MHKKLVQLVLLTRKETSRMTLGSLVRQGLSQKAVLRPEGASHEERCVGSRMGLGWFQDCQNPSSPEIREQR